MKNLSFAFTIILLVSVVMNTNCQTIQGTLYLDLNSSGAYEPTDRGFQNANIYLLESCQNGVVIDTTVTDANGFYTFNVGIGEYEVRMDVNDPIAGNLFPNGCCFQVTSNSQIETCNLGLSMPDCLSHPYSVDNLCELAFDNPLVNLEVIGDIACGQLPTIVGNWNGQAHCGGTFENTSFFGFVAGTGDYSISISVFNCAGNGVQYGIMDSCSPGGPYNVCNGNANNGIITIDGSALEPCKKYVLWLDGYSGSVCSYFAQVVGDFNICDSVITTKDDIILDLSLNLICDSLCNQSFEKLIDIVSKDNLPAIDTFQWLISNASLTLMETTTSPSLNVSNLSVGQYNVCVFIDSSATYNSVNYCKNIVIENDYNVVRDTFTLCETELPWFGASDGFGNKLLDVFGNHWRWAQGPIIWSDLVIGPNVFVNNRVDKCGCDYQQEISIIYHVRDQPCDDMDAGTINDIVLDDCTCKGESTSGFQDNTTWYYRPYTLTQTNDIWKVKALRDTLINGETYKIVAMDRGNGVLKHTEIPLLLVGGKMYFHELGQKKLLYDFTAKVGDVVTYYVPKIQRFYDISSNGGFTEGEDKAYKLQIESVDTLVTAEGKNLKLFRITSIGRNGESHFFSDIVENVGSTFGLFGAFGPFLTSGTEGSIRCFEDVSGFYSIFSEYCSLVSVHSSGLEKSFSLYPNPVQNLLYLTGNNINEAILTCYDLNGNRLNINQNYDGDNVVLDVRSLPLGIYLILVKANNHIVPLRFVKLD